MERMGLSNLETREREEGQGERDDPEAYYDFRLGPAELLKVVMNRRH